MPRLPVDYKNTIIYKIVCNDLKIKDTYVGHTTDFKSRKKNLIPTLRNSTATLKIFNGVLNLSLNN